MPSASGRNLFRTLALVAWAAATVWAGWYGFGEPEGGGSAAIPVAKLASVRGEVEYRARDVLVWFPAEQGLELADLDHVATASAGSATVALGSGHYLVLGPDSHVIVERGGDGDDGGVNYTVTLTRGDLKLASPGEAPKPVAGPLTVKAKKTAFKVQKADAKLELRMARSGPLRVLAMKGVTTSSSVKVESGARPEEPAARPQKTDEPTPPAAPKPDALAAKTAAPRITEPADGAVFWTDGGAVARASLDVKLESAGRASVRVKLGEKVLATVSGAGAGKRTLKVPLARLTGGLSGQALRLEPAVEAQAGGKPVTGSAIEVRIQAVSAADKRHFLATFGAGAAQGKSGALVPTAGAAKAGGAALELFDGGTLARALPFLAQRSGLALSAGTTARGATAVYFVKGAQLVAVLQRAGAAASLVPQLAKALGATTALEAETGALTGADRVKVPAGELAPLLQSWGAERFWIVVKGKPRSLSAELVVHDEHALAIVRDALGPFKKPVKVLYPQGAGG